MIDVVLELGSNLGFAVASQELLSQHALWPLVRILPSGKPAVVLRHPEGGATVSVIPEQSFTEGTWDGSMNMSHVPDVVVHFERPGETVSLAVFDPKYKLASEDAGDPEVDGSPKKVDIDKMHVYRDAIHDPQGRRVVDHAAILYPGPLRRFEGGITAIPAVPGHEDQLRVPIREILSEPFRALTGA